MGSPLVAQVVANFYMEHFEQKALVAASMKSVQWYRHADDTFVGWPHGKDELGKFQEQLNSIRPNIRFTTETEEDNSLPFLNMLVKRKQNGTLGHTIYRKPMNTYLHLHASSHQHPS
jgi:hypothetical protein